MLHGLREVSFCHQMHLQKYVACSMLINGNKAGAGEKRGNSFSLSEAPSQRTSVYIHKNEQRKPYRILKMATLGYTYHVWRTRLLLYVDRSESEVADYKK